MLQLKNIVKEYPVGDGKVTALKGISLDFRDSEFVAVLGPSGCGKTTLLNIIGGLDSYTSGDLMINGISTKDYKDADWDAYRNHSVGFVFQSYNLISHQTALSNVEMALKISGESRADRKERAIKALEKVGLGDQIYKKPNMMSGGQMQRVAIARALVNDPDIILADEPTGAIDSETSVQIMDLLKEVADDRLVVMVTHNPDLADEYANRIVRLKDGKVISDTNPLSPKELKEGKQGKPFKRAKLKFQTALGLSFNNLLTKKGRTLLTAFAGAIGIIGIALILALSNGMNDYIAGIESDTMGSYPIELEKETIDFSGMTEGGGSEGIGVLGGSTSDGEDTQEKDGIFSDNIVADSVSSAKELMAKNNLSAFKTYLDDNYADVQESISAVEYAYDVVPQVFRTQSESVMQVSPSTLLEDDSSSRGMMSGGMSEMSGMSISSSTSSAWVQAADNPGLRDKQYTVLEGTWPTEYNEVALVINDENTVSDYTLYTLGLMDIDTMNALVEAVEEGAEYEDPQMSFSYGDAIGLEYKVFAQSDLYKPSDEGDGVWVDKTDDEDYLLEIFDSGTPITITAVLQSTDDADVSNGVVYTGALTEYLMDKTAQSEIVQQQLADPNINVLTGEAFEDEEDESAEESSETESANTQVSSYAESTENSGGLMSDAGTIPQTMAAKYTPSTSLSNTTAQAAYPTSNTPSLITVTSSMSGEEADDAEDVEPPATTYTVRFLNYDKAVLSSVEPNYVSGDTVKNVPTETPTRSADATYAYTFLGWKSSTTNSVYTDVADIPVVTEDVDYVAFYYSAPVIPTGTTPEIPSIEEAPSGENYGNIPSGSIGGYDPSSLGSLNASNRGTAYPTDALYASGSMELSNDQLSILLAQMSDTTPASYEDVLEALGYADKNEPASIALYPADFEAKTEIESFIEQYNNQVESDVDKVTYTDMIGTITSSLTSIINIISYVLIAFVAISLVVSSIMIAIITYISVLERTKEIGILRALGASKGDVTKIFNAETFIEGLVSGVLGIVVTLLLCIPINAVISSMFGADNIASLPLEYSLVLIAISVVLTLLAGFIPARMAAKKDPVVALRTE